jgi:microcompartment protein CcmK/EutM
VAGGGLIRAARLSAQPQLPSPSSFQMLIAKVVGSVVATRKDEKLGSQKLLVCQVHDQANQPKAQYVVAIDAVGAGPGDMVLYATGSSARQTHLTEGKPCDAVIMAIVDSWDLGGDNVYEKWS